MAKVGNFCTSKFIFLCPQLEKASSKTKLNEWKAYPFWKLEASRRGSHKISSLHEVNKKVVEIVSELKAPKASKCQDPISSLFYSSLHYTLCSPIFFVKACSLSYFFLLLLYLLHYHSLLT